MDGRGAGGWGGRAFSVGRSGNRDNRKRAIGWRSPRGGKGASDSAGSCWIWDPRVVLRTLKSGTTHPCLSVYWRQTQEEVLFEYQEWVKALGANGRPGGFQRTVLSAFGDTSCVNQSLATAIKSTMPSFRNLKRWGSWNWSSEHCEPYSVWPGTKVSLLISCEYAT